jgi:transcriptional regulator with XRE-family HTH domain
MHEELIASNIKMVRKNRKMTLDQLAALTGLTKGYLSKIERSKKAPPYSTINKIAVAFGVDAASLIGEGFSKTAESKISFTRKDHGRIVPIVRSLSEGSLYGYSYEALAVDKRGKNMEPYIIEPAFGEEAIFEHEGEEFVYVLEGTHALVYGGERFVMRKGDSVYFDATVPHTGISPGKRKARLLAAMYNYRRL